MLCGCTALLHCAAARRQRAGASTSAMHKIVCQSGGSDCFCQPNLGVYGRVLCDICIVGYCYVYVCMTVTDMNGLCCVVCCLVLCYAKFTCHPGQCIIEQTRHRRRKGLGRLPEDQHDHHAGTSLRCTAMCCACCAAALRCCTALLRAARGRERGYQP